MTLGQAVDSMLVARFSCVGEKVGTMSRTENTALDAGLSQAA